MAVLGDDGLHGERWHQSSLMDVIKKLQLCVGGARWYVEWNPGWKEPAL